MTEAELTPARNERATGDHELPVLRSEGKLAYMVLKENSELELASAGGSNPHGDTGFMRRSARRLRFRLQNSQYPADFFLLPVA